MRHRSLASHARRLAMIAVAIGIINGIMILGLQRRIDMLLNRAEVTSDRIDINSRRISRLFDAYVRDHYPSVDPWQVQEPSELPVFVGPYRDNRDGR